jgi:hypothetical protein
MALELSDTRTIKITHGTPHPIRADNARIIGMDETTGIIRSGQADLHPNPSA